MRAGGACTAQQTLTTEAASVLKHSLSLARRRGHAQVTPLHVAATLLSPRASLLKRACLKSQQPQITPHHHSHPLQCRALELCFNVALNRLPTIPSPLLHAQQPSLSNALIAALKRAQAHQRRGSIEQQHQNQPLLAIKVELEQLILSILDDPSVSRVMREAGFSSTAVKNNLEDYSLPPSVFSSSVGGVYSSPSSLLLPLKTTPQSFWQTHFLAYNSDPNPHFSSPQKRVPITESAHKEDIKLVFREIMDKIERKDVPDELKSVHFIKFLFSSVPLRFMKREEVEMNLADLKRKVDSSLTSGGGGGVIIYTGDLKWTVGEREISGYNPVDHLVSDIGRLVCEWANSSNTKKVWLMGTANYQTYTRCQMRQPSLEIQWSLQAVSVPSGGLGLSLHGTTTRPLYISSCNTKDMEKGSTQLPHWLQSQPTGMQKNDLVELRRKWNRLCHSQHQDRHIHNHTSPFLFNNQNIYGKSNTFPSSSPCLATRNTTFPDTSAISFAHSTPKPNSLPRFRRQQSCHIEFSFSSNGNHKHQSLEPNLDSLKNTEEKEVKITLSLGNSNSQFFDRGKSGERKSEISKILQENVPWQLETIPLIVEALIEYNLSKETNWLLIRGNDSIGKRRLTRGIAESMFGSADLLLHLNMREKEGKISLCCEKLERALRDHENLVVLVEDVDFADTQFLKFLSDGYETGKFGKSGKIEGKSGQLIFILTKGDSSKDLNSVTQIKLEVTETIPNNKRKLEAEWDLPNKAKSPRIDEKGNTNILGTHEKGNVKKEFTRQSSSNTLDLNMKADEEDDETEAKEGDLSPISSDLTREMGNDYQTPHGFLESIKNQFVFNRDWTSDDLMKEIILCKIKGSFEEVCGSEGDLGCLLGGVEEKLLEELLLACGSFLNNHFEKWLKDVFQTSLQTVKFGGKEGVVSIRLCLGGKEESGLDLEGCGFMGSSLPKKIQVSFMG
ncbi:double Clp-N motif-containing P-loop nucleoside triphosphate hydrolases superfamily protein [Actinidia rufa]|uniref:Double Clp-N motif-containing P-loop nucleoside triphosphate hydrolases superfamily protein n=1 Tax=Actinidia rufa TaxID=165716 RepID=A0A7J0GEC4_9ERIC|nr:double Clp-N motif-containing P-loop nucleoside triphosphate hydrolases superfamily protein [Actinidia rufa]